MYQSQFSHGMCTLCYITHCNIQSFLASPFFTQTQCTIEESETILLKKKPKLLKKQHYRGSYIFPRTLAIKWSLISVDLGRTGNVASHITKRRKAQTGKKDLIFSI